MWTGHTTLWRAADNAEADRGPSDGGTATSERRSSPAHAGERRASAEAAAARDRARTQKDGCLQDRPHRQKHLQRPCSGQEMQGNPDC